VRSNIDCPFARAALINGLGLKPNWKIPANRRISFDRNPVTFGDPCKIDNGEHLDPATLARNELMSSVKFRKKNPAHKSKVEPIHVNFLK
jgi:hypothetical protein